MVRPEKAIREARDFLSLEFKTELGRLNALMSVLVVVVMAFSHIYLGVSRETGFEYKHSAPLTFFVLFVLFLFSSLVVVAYSGEADQVQ